MALEKIKTDVLVIGAGIAGAATALAAARAGLRVVVLAKSSHSESSTNTLWAQGGIIYRGRGDSADLLVGDIVAAGGGNVDPRAARQLATWGPRLVKRLLIDELRVRLAIEREQPHVLSQHRNERRVRTRWFRNRTSRIVAIGRGDPFAQSAGRILDVVHLLARVQPHACALVVLGRDLDLSLQCLTGPIVLATLQESGEPLVPFEEAGVTKGPVQLSG